MRILILVSLLVTAPICGAYEGSELGHTWSVVSEGEYNNMPLTKVNMKRLKKWGKYKLAQATKRTISDKSDILPYFEKLVHANGVCLLGEWQITEANPYSGYFKKNSHGKIISRASVALSNTKRGKVRSFGLAGKIFPTLSMKEEKLYKTANFFTMDDLGGTKVGSFFKTKLTNEPDLSFHLSSVFMIRMAAFVNKVFKAADSNPGIRQLWQISSLGEKDESMIRTPMWMRLSGNNEFATSRAKDFRSEIINNIENNGEIEFDIEVAGSLSKGSSQNKNFMKIGKIKISDYSLSEGCDHRLHFNHPKFRYDLN